MAQTVAITDANFFARVLGSRSPVLVEFWLEGCGPCAALKPTVDRFAAAREDVAVLTYEVVQRSAAHRRWKRYDIQHTPTLILFRDGEPIWRTEGPLTVQQIHAGVDAALAAPQQQGVA